MHENTTIYTTIQPPKIDFWNPPYKENSTYYWVLPNTSRVCIWWRHLPDCSRTKFRTTAMATTIHTHIRIRCCSKSGRQNRRYIFTSGCMHAYSRFYTQPVEVVVVRGQVSPKLVQTGGWTGRKIHRHVARSPLGVLAYFDAASYWCQDCAIAFIGKKSRLGLSSTN